MINTNDLLINKLKLGMLLKAIRENEGVSQRDIALGIGYSNATFVCNVEKGANNMPIDKIFEFARNYAPADITMLSLAILRLAHPTAWTTCYRAFSDGFDVDADKKLEKKVDKWIGKQCAQFDIKI